VCRSTNTAVKSTLTAESAAAFLCSTSKDADRHKRMSTAIRNVWQGDDCEIRRCEECRFGFGNPFVGGDAQFYSIMHEQHGYPSWRWDYDMALANAPAGGQALDIGAGRGFFLKGLAKGWSRFAVESTQTMKSLLRKDGIEAFDDLAEAPDSNFDMVTMFQVLEHISDFRGVLSECFRVLKPGGSLIITVPDADAMFDQEVLTGCPDSPPNHVAKWTPDTLARVLDELGFVVHSWAPEPPTWKRVRAMMHIKLMAQATHDKSWASRAYGIKNRNLRAAALAGLAGLGAPAMLPRLKQLRAGGAFGIVATKGPAASVATTG